MGHLKGAIMEGRRPLTIWGPAVKPGVVGGGEGASRQQGVERAMPNMLQGGALRGCMCQFVQKAWPLSCVISNITGHGSAL
jgi:hypothetical protein